MPCKKASGSLSEAYRLSIPGKKLTGVRRSQGISNSKQPLGRISG
jgi:hypothetical protein